MNGVLELIHLDACGPFQVTSLGGAKYFLTFIDDFLKMTFVYFLSTKNDVFEKFVQFCHAIERQIGQKILPLRTDNGGEFTSKEFQDYCASKGIKRQFS